jgi:DNA-binding response OmpR family regulator
MKAITPRIVTPGPHRIIVVDDDAAVCNSLKFSLELDGFQVSTYASGNELLASPNVQGCDCFVIDQRLPGLSGFELIAELRKRDVSASAILIVSGGGYLGRRRSNSEIAVLNIGRRGQFGRVAGPHHPAAFDDGVAVRDAG